MGQRVEVDYAVCRNTLSSLYYRGLLQVENQIRLRNTTNECVTANHDCRIFQRLVVLHVAVHSTHGLPSSSTMRSYYNNTDLRGDFTGDNTDSVEKKKRKINNSILDLSRGECETSSIFFFITNSPPKCNCRGLLGCTYKTQ